MDFVITLRDAKPGSFEENEAIPLQNLGASCRCGCIVQCWVLCQGRFPTQRQANA